MAWRNVYYNGRTSSVHLWGWDEEGNRIKTVSSFDPYLYVESDSHKDGISIFDTALKKVSFKNQYERGKWLKTTPITRTFHNFGCEQQFLLDMFKDESFKEDFGKNPIRIAYLDIETFGGIDEQYSTPEAATDPINLITVYDSFTERYKTFGLEKRFKSKDTDVDYTCYDTEQELLESFIRYWQKKEFDVVSGWNCISENENVWNQHSIKKIKNLSNDKLFLCDSLIKKENTGIKKEFSIKTNIGGEILCSQEHIIPVLVKPKHLYKNKNTILKLEKDLKVKEINLLLDDNDVYIKQFFNTNDRPQLTYRDYIIDNLDNFSDYNIDFFIKSEKIKEKLKTNEVFMRTITKLEYFYTKDAWKRKPSIWKYSNLKQYITKNDIVSYIKETDQLEIFRKRRSDCIINLDDTIEFGLLRLIGFLFTDGSFDKKDEVFTFSSKLEKMMNLYIGDINRLLNKDLVDSRGRKQDNNFYKKVNINNKIGLLLPMFYKNTFKKYLNIEILSKLSNKQFFSFFAGLYDGDGCSDPHSVGLCHYCHDDNVKIIHELLFWNNVRSTKTKNFIRIPNLNRNKSFFNFLYDNSYNTERKTSIILMKDSVQKTCIGKNIKTFEYEDFVITKIVSLKETGLNVQMYDIETKTHYFYCNGMKVHNCVGYDIPYLINRIKRILSEEDAAKLSPVNSIYLRMNASVNRMGQMVNRWVIHGITILDYMEVYITFALGSRESYSLAYISEYEIKETKTTYNTTSLAELSIKDWNLFVEYNIQDVRLLVKLEEKLKYIALVKTLSYKGFVPFERAMGKVSLIAGALAFQAYKEGKITPVFNVQNERGDFEGGFVKEPTPGLYKDVISFDANSLYPNTILTLNISPETKIGKIIKIDDEDYTLRLVNGKLVETTKEKVSALIKNQKLALSSSKVIFDQKVKGIIPSFIEDLYKERVAAKDEMMVIKKSLEKVTDKTEREKLKAKSDDKNIEQGVLKVLLNSVYGIFAQPFSPYFDIDLAESVTLTGQSAIKKAPQLAFEHIKSLGVQCEMADIWIAGDTDSLYVSISKLLEHKNIELLDGEDISKEAFACIEDINNFVNKEINIWAREELNTLDPRFFFKREAICDVAVFLAKKNYIMHILDQESVKTNKFKYVGVEVAKSTHAKEVKVLIKNVVENVILSQDRIEGNRIYQKSFEDFSKMPIDIVASRKKVNDYDKYANQIQPDGEFVSRTPGHVRAAINYNRMLEMLKLEKKYPKIGNGQKIKTFYCKKNIHQMISMAFGNEYPIEFKEDIEIDYRIMFEKMVLPLVEKVYGAIGWKIPDVNNPTYTDLLSYFSD